eukprot:scaffold2143_cov254-Chaetoceros_neogracile.AAC.3
MDGWMDGWMIDCTGGGMQYDTGEKDDSNKKERLKILSTKISNWESKLKQAGKYEKLVQRAK